MGPNGGRPPVAASRGRWVERSSDRAVERSRDGGIERAVERVAVAVSVIVVVSEK